MTTTTTTYQFLEPRPGSSYKQLFIKGTKLRAFTVYSAARPRGDDDDQTPEEVAENYGIPAEAVYEAIRYVESKPAEVDYDFRRADLIYEATGMSHPDYRTDPKRYRRSLTVEDYNRIERQLETEFGRL